VCWAVGALFDYVAGEEMRAPNWVNKAGVEWFWRLIMDPKGKWKRYLVGNPLFMSRVVREWLIKS
ncbi:MAG: WecB/TagA/CpsF family glycosyltransferase, partial [Chloroflexota bacterium]|nr:WecB/TagA/CpsF family glycosyltransferase [Chloroflexota bacterium]